MSSHAQNSLKGFSEVHVRTELHFGGEYNDLMPQHLFTEKKIKGFKSLEI